MRATLSLLTVAVVLTGIGALDAHATSPQGPFCFTTPPFTDTFAWFFDSHGGNQFDGTGRDLTLNRPMAVTGFLSGGEFHVNWVTSPGTAGTPILGGGFINVATGTGPGRCHTVNSVGGCGTGTNFAYTLVGCPPGALTSTEALRAASGPLMDGSE